MSMCKKIGITAVAIVAGLIVLNKTSLGSYVGFSWKKAKDSLTKAVPPEIEVERLRHDLTQLDPEIKRARSTLAEEAVSVEMLRDDVVRTQANLKKKLDEILSAKKDVDGATEFVTYNTRKVSINRAKSLLAADWEAYKRAEEGLKSKEKLLEAKEAALGEGHKQLAGMTGLKEQLNAELDQVEAELKTLRLAQVRSNIQIDNTRLTRFKNSMAELKKRIKIETKEMEYEGIFSTPTTSEKTVDVTDKALKEIDERFGKVAAER